MSANRRANARRMLAVWCPDWPVTAAGHAQSSPVAVVAGDRLVAASQAARASGVAPGQRRREAESLCPEIVFTAHDPGAEGRSFECVVQALEEFGGPVVVVRPGLAACPTRGPARYFGGDDRFAESVGRAIKACAARLGLAPGDGQDGSLCGEWWGVGVADGIFAATIAAQLAVLVPPGAAARFLAPFGVDLLGRPELSDVLRRLGITTLGDFAALREEDVLSRFGPDGGRAHRLARGLDGRRHLSRRQLDGRAVESTLEPPAESLEAAVFLTKQLAGQVSEELSREGLACTLLEIEVETSLGERFVRRWSHEGAWATAVVAERLRWQLESWLQSEPAGEEVARGISRIRITPLEVGPDTGRQLELWGRRRTDQERVGRSLVRVQGLLGAEEVLLPFLVGGRGPADRVRTVPFGDPPPPDSASRPPWPGQVPAPNPAAVPKEPLSADLLDRQGNRLRVDGRGIASAAPATLALSGGSAVPVVAWAGPWPVDERWWDRRSHRRRARFQLLTASGEAYLLAVEGGRWLVEGIYD